MIKFSRWNGMRTMSYRIALSGLAAVLLALTVFGVSSALRTNHATQRVSVSSELSSAYERARFAVGEEESLERKYRLEPGPAVRAKFDHAAQELEAALRETNHLGAETDRRQTVHLLSVHRTFLRATHRLFAAVDARDTKRVLAIDADQVDPRFAVIEDGVAGLATAQRLVAARDLNGLRDTERSVLTATPLAFALGLLLLGVLTVLLARINRQLAQQARDSEHNALHDALTGLQTACCSPTGWSTPSTRPAGTPRCSRSS